MNITDNKDQRKDFSLKARMKSFRHAFRGILTLFRNEHNARIHLAVFTAVVIAGFLFRISGTQWLAILIVSGMVLAGECFNSAIEYLSDIISLEKNESIRKAKDVAAAGVLISAIISVITGLIIFIPEIIRVIRAGR